ncbi:MAG: sugar phosphate isomerase/epimerase [Kiritimatiellaeota bacterium]|nr:sugar phosphate isomerase/epimerase [Kiritimatiellota bacterium]
MKTRRTFIKTAALGLAATALTQSASRLRAQNAPPRPAPDAPARPVMLGLASYTIRKFDLDTAIAMLKRLGLARIVLKDAHLPLDSTDEKIREVTGKIKAAGITPYGCGTVYMKKPAEVERAFAYAAAAGFDMIVGAPNTDLLPLCEQCAKATGVRLAIHNHGPDNPLYPSPLDAYALIKGMDARMGLCMDIGHTQRLGQDPAAVFKTTFDRVFDLHVKDVSASSKAGKTVEMGRGVIDLVAFLKTVLALGYTGTLGFEHEKDSGDPLAGVAESVGYTRGILKTLGASWR